MAGSAKFGNRGSVFEASIVPQVAVSNDANRIHWAHSDGSTAQSPSSSAFEIEVPFDAIVSDADAMLYLRYDPAAASRYSYSSCLYSHGGNVILSLTVLCHPL